MPDRPHPPRTSLTTRTTCRICGSPELAPVLSLGDQYIAGAFAEPGGEQPVQRAIPLELVRCDMTRDEEACGLIQTRHTVPGSILYHSYWYRSGINRTMTENLHGIAQAAQELVGLVAGDLVVDIGCNDGTLLDGYTAENISLPRLRPLRRRPATPSRRATTSCATSSPRGPFSERYADRKAKVVTSIAMFYDLEDPRDFVADVAAVLAERRRVGDGAALPADDARDELVRRDRPRAPRVLLAGRARAAVRRGGARGRRTPSSTTSTAARSGSSSGTPASSSAPPSRSRAVQALRIREFELALDSPSPTRSSGATRAVRDELSSAAASDLKAEGKTVHVYGASTKGNTILQYAGIDTLAGLARRRPQPGQVGLGDDRARGIPIISEEESRAMKPDYYLALPWHFLDEFLERETEFLERGGRFIVPLPDVRIVPE